MDSTGFFGELPNSLQGLDQNLPGDGTVAAKSVAKIQHIHKKQKQQQDKAHHEHTHTHTYAYIIYIYTNIYIYMYYLYTSGIFVYICFVHSHTKHRLPHVPYTRLPRTWGSLLGGSGYSASTHVALEAHRWRSKTGASPVDFPFCFKANKASHREVFLRLDFSDLEIKSYLTSSLGTASTKPALDGKLVGPRALLKMSQRSRCRLCTEHGLSPWYEKYGSSTANCTFVVFEWFLMWSSHESWV